MTRRIYVYFAATFAAGLICGAVGMFLYGWYGGAWRHSFNKERALKRLTEELSLTPAQIPQVSRIMDEGRARMDEVQKQVEPQFQAVREESRTKIRALLNPDQAPKFDALVKQWDARRRRMGPPGPPPSPPNSK
jgi:Spy/CpxP family protein refolding chaperone